VPICCQVSQLTSCLAGVLRRIGVYLDSPAHTLDVGDRSWVWTGRSWILAGVTLEIDIKSRAVRKLIAAVSVSRNYRQPLGRMLTILDTGPGRTCRAL